MAEAGYPNGFKTVLSNRAIKLPYIDFGVYLISSWKKIGVEAEHQLKEAYTQFFCSCPAQHEQKNCV